MHLIFGLAMLGLVIMVALFLANIVITIVMLIIGLPVAGVAALFNRFRK